MPVDRRGAAGDDRMVRQRLWVLAGVLGVFALLPVVKLGQVQVRDADVLVESGKKQRRSEEPIQPMRGAILDRHGVELAASVPRASVALSRRALTTVGLTSVADLEELAIGLAHRLGVDRHEMVATVLGADRDDDHVPLADDLDPERAEAARAYMRRKGLPGALGVTLRDVRVHPSGPSGMPVIGTLSPDGPGPMAGIERAWDEHLSGRSGLRVVERDPAGNTIIGSEQVLREPRPGSDVETTLDRTLQYQAERSLMQGAVDASASEGVAIIGVPGTGELLAVAAVERDPDTGRIRRSTRPLAFSSAYQAGSVFKLVTVAAAYEAGVVTPDRLFTVPDTITIEDAEFEDAHEHATEQMDVDRIVAESSNVGTIQIGLFLGRDKLYRALEDFGFGRRTGVGHPAEAEGQLPPSEGWTLPDLAAAAIGTFQTTTPVQLWSAYNVIANDGRYVPPRLVSATIGPDGRRHERPMAPTRRVISAASAADVDRALRRVVERGTARQWSLPGYPVAAKTGTSRIPSPTRVDPDDSYVWSDGRYHHVTTFAGYLPADRPQVSITVLLYDTAPGLSGSTSAGPVFSDLARLSIRELGIAPTQLAAPSDDTAAEGADGVATAEEVPSGTLPHEIGRIRAAPATGAAPGGGSTRSAAPSTTMTAPTARSPSTDHRGATR